MITTIQNNNLTNRETVNVTFNSSPLPFSSNK